MRDKPLRIIPTTPSRYAPPFGAPRGLALNGRVKLRVVPSCGYGVVVRPSGFFNHVRHLPDARPLRDLAGPARRSPAGRHTPPAVCAPTPHIATTRLAAPAVPRGRIRRASVKRHVPGHDGATTRVDAPDRTAG